LNKPALVGNCQEGPLLKQRQTAHAGPSTLSPTGHLPVSLVPDSQ
jgi:hypothetical protein